MQAAAEATAKIVSPQPGFQEKFLASPADITIGGGSAGCGKSWAELAASIPWLHLPLFRAVLFRRTTPQIRNPGGLWDESMKVYMDLQGDPISTFLRWTFPSGAQVSMGHLEQEKDKYDWQGAQIALLIFDELCHFSESQFWYLQSRNRSMCGIRPYTLATCNPDADSWVAKLIEWWIDQETGFAIPERSGVLRYCGRIGDDIAWGDTPAEVMAKAPDLAEVDVKSVTFIPGKLEENQELLRVDPGYRGKLMGLSRVERSRLLDGNWKIRKTAGTFFQRGEVKIIDKPPTDLVEVVRWWDLAATEPSDTNPDPDWTCGVKLGRTKDKRYVVLDVIYVRVRSHKVHELIHKTAEIDGKAVKIWLPQDPGQAGKDQSKGYITDLAGFVVAAERESGSKETRADPLAAQWQAGNVDIVRGPWNDWYFAHMEAFPTKGVHDDPVDATAGAFSKIGKRRTVFEVM